MKVAHILPTSLLEVTREYDYLMCLGHLIDVDQAYTQFYKERADEGAFVIMDNGVYETGTPLDIEEICRRANLIGASEIILPDYFREGERSFEATAESIKYARENFKGKLMAVPQGEDGSDWLGYAIMVLSLDVDTIGIPKWLSAKNEWARLEVLQYLGNMLRGLDIHLLGCATSPIESQIINSAVKAKEILPVRGIDSCIAYKYAEAGMLFEDGARPTGEMDFDAPKLEHKDLVLLSANMRDWDMLASI